MRSTILKDANNILLFLILFFTGLYFAASFLIPVAYAVILAMLLLPLRKRLEKSGLHRVWSTFICVFILFIAICSLAYIIANQLALIMKDLPVIEKKVTELVEDLRAYLTNQWGISSEQQSALFSSFSLEGQRESIKKIMPSFAMQLGNVLLVMVYVYVFLYFKGHFERFILKLVPDHNSPKAEKIMHDASTVAERYLIGKLILMVFLVVVYSLAFLIIGIKYAVLYAIIAALLSFIPYIGNIIGAGLPLTMTLLNNNFASAIAVVVVFFVIQFIETYIFEPLIVGKNVNLNPPFTIIIIIIGGAVWGISGMILAMPYLGIMQIIFSYIEPLKPYGYLIGDTEAPRNDWINRLLNKIQHR